jgi:hypothetical protein
MVLLGGFHNVNVFEAMFACTMSDLRHARYAYLVSFPFQLYSIREIDFGSSDTNTITYNQTISNIKTPIYTKFCSDYSVMKNVKDVYRYFILQVSSSRSTYGIRLVIPYAVLGLLCNYLL